MWFARTSFALSFAGVISGVSYDAVTGPDGAAIAVVTPRGELDLAAIASLDSALRSALATAGRGPRLVIDLSDVSLLHPVVLGVLLDARRRCRAADGGMVLVVSASEITATLVETEVASLFDTVAGLHVAIERLADR